MFLQIMSEMQRQTIVSRLMLESSYDSAC